MNYIIKEISYRINMPHYLADKLFRYPLAMKTSPTELGMLQ